MADTFKYVQSQPFSLAGAGAIAGATSITLKSFKTIDGTNLTMTDFGSIGFGTIEPGNGTQEEQICFTGVTQNANGTATLTGVSSVLFVAPYTKSSGLAKTHPGSTVFVISNTAGFYDYLSGKNNDETVTGIWTFTSPNYPRMDSVAVPPTLDTEFATKKYADDLAIAGSPVASTSVIGISKLSYAPLVSTSPIAVADTDPRVPPVSTTSVTAGMIAALPGTSGTPSNSNKYVTNDDVATAATASKVVRRLASGDITVPSSPTNTTDATSKTYVDTRFTTVPQTINEITSANTTYITYATNQAGDNMVAAYRDTGSTSNLYLVRFSKDSNTSQWYNTGDAVTITPGGTVQTGQPGIAFIGSYVYVSLSSNTPGSFVYRMTATNLAAGATSMTISGTAPSTGTGEHIMFTNGTDLIIHSTSTTWYRYTISGTTITNAETLTGPSTPQGAYYDGTNLYIFDSAALKKYSTSLGSATATTSIGASNIVGLGYASSTIIYLMSRVAGAATYLMPITKN